MSVKMNVLITGGGGFIGLNLANELLKSGYNIRILDNLEPQVHGINPAIMDSLRKNFDFMYADINDQSSIDSALYGTNAVIHLAASPVKLSPCMKLGVMSGQMCRLLLICSKKY